MLERITQDELDLVECLSNPISAAECIFDDLENATHNEEMSDLTLANVRFAQFPMMNFEYLLDEDPNLSYKENFKLHEGMGNIDCFGGRNFGKCSWEEDYCLMADGRYMKFKDLKNTIQEVVSLNPDNQKFESKLAFFKDNGKRDCYELILKSGKKITVTENHPLLTDSGWVNSENLSVGNYIATAKRFDFEGSLDVDDNLAKLLGYLLGDGSCTGKQIAFTNINEEIISEFIYLCQYFDCDVTKNDITYYVKARKFSSKKNNIKQIVEKYSINRLAKDKQIPEEVFTWKNKYIALLLNRLFACDAHSSNLNRSIEFTVASENLVKQVSSLLIRFGIHSRIYKKKAIFKDGKKFEAFRLFITADSDKFHKLIGIKTKNFKTSFEKLFSNSDLIPKNIFSSFYDELSDKKKLNLRKLKRYDVSRSKLADINAVLKNKNIECILNSDIYWDKIKTIQKIQNVNTVAVSVLDNHNYIQNDVISHNTWIVEVIDILIACIWLDNIESGFSSTDSIKIRAILEEKLIPVLTKHPFYQMMNPKINRSPNYKIAFPNGFTIIGINMNVMSKAPGQNFFGKHLKRLYVEEASFESLEVYGKRIDARSEIGCVTRSAGMTTFTPYMPAGKRFYSEENRPWVCNLPQYCNPNWDDKTKQEAMLKHGGENSISYRVFVKGEVVEEGISVFDMERVKRNYLENKVIKHFEITKKNYANFKDILVVDKPAGVEEVYIAADIGESAPTEIAIFFKRGDKYRYSYNITAYNLTDKEQPAIFLHLANVLGANYIGVDTTDGTGRSIFRTLADSFAPENMVWCSFTEKLKIGFEVNDKGQLVKDSNGNPVYKEEYVSEWSVKRLKDLFYEERMSIPQDYKLDVQLNSVVGTMSGARTVYQVMGEEDHLFAAFRVFAIMQWDCEFKNARPTSTKRFGKSGA